jgi:uncharacterized cupin superfamily protein
VDYTIKNLREVEDMAAAQGFGEVQEARFAHGDLDSEQIGVSLQRVKPGKRHAFAHRHKEAEEMYVVLAGSGRVKLDDKIEDIREFDAIRVGPSVTRAFEAGDKGLELLAFSPRAAGDAEIVEDFSWE